MVPVPVPSRPATPLAVFAAARGLRAKQLAETAGVTAGYLSQCMNGRRPSPRVQRSLSGALGVEVAVLFPSVGQANRIHGARRELVVAESKLLAAQALLASVDPAGLGDVEAVDLFVGAYQRVEASLARLRAADAAAFDALQPSAERNLMPNLIHVPGLVTHREDGTDSRQIVAVAVSEVGADLADAYFVSDEGQIVRVGSENEHTRIRWQAGQ